MSETRDFTEQLLPSAPSDEIPRDSLVRQIAAGFGCEHQYQIVVSGRQTGKTNLLAQFVRLYNGHCAAYFVTASPLSQLQHPFLYAMCCQMSAILNKQPPAESSGLTELKALFETLRIQLTNRASKNKQTFYFVVDAVDQALTGTEGERIVDVLPLTTAALSPYMLCSCRSEEFDRLPERLRQCTLSPGQFSRLETETYLSNSGFTQDQIVRVHQRYQGIPGFLKSIKDSKKADPDFNPETAPVALDRLVCEQVAAIMGKVHADTARALEILAASPTPLACQVLSEVATADMSDLSNALQGTGLVEFDPRSHRLEFVNDLVQNSIRKRAGDRMKEHVRLLLEHVRNRHPEEKLLEALLCQADQDYDGLCSTLAIPAVVQAIDKTGGISSIIKRMRIALDMAQEREKTEDVIEWTLALAAAKSFLEHACSSDEIDALLSIGETQAAIARAYAVPETSTKVRLLARAYGYMKSHGDALPPGALEELSSLVEDLALQSLERELAEEIAVDLLPVLPDSAWALLEKGIAGSERRSLIESAIHAIEASQEEAGDDSSGLRRRARLGYASQVLSSWLNGMPYEKLVKELSYIESTGAKEYVLRQWCRQNREDARIAEAVDQWLTTVVEDCHFNILLSSLRHISGVVRTVPIDERRRLIDKLRASHFQCLSSPLEEWVGFHLNLAEATLAFDPDAARDEARTVHAHLRSGGVERDVMVFCLARLWATIVGFVPQDSAWIREVDSELEEAINSFLGNSAEQLEPLLGSFRVLARVDVEYALTVASFLNTHKRRSLAIRAILIAALTAQSQTGLEKHIQDALELLTEPERNSALVHITSELSGREVTLSLPILTALLDSALHTSDPSLQAKTLSNLARLFSVVSRDQALEIADRAIEIWRLEDDLKVKLGLGYQLVESLGELDVERARKLYAEVKELRHQPGAPLAVGRLGAAFCEMLELAIRAVTRRDLSDDDLGAQALEGLVREIPSWVVRVRLYAKLAATAYRLGSTEYADRVVADQILPEIDLWRANPRQSQFAQDLWGAVEVSLPVISEYDMPTAVKLAEDLPYGIKDNAWFSAILWSLCRGYLGDHYFDPADLRIPSDHRRLRKAIDAAKEIHFDLQLCGAIECITAAIKTSHPRSLDSIQAFELLADLDVLASRLPEQSHENITHEGYRVFAEASVHGARSAVFSREKARQLTRKDMTKRWDTICAEAEGIPNQSDRVLVMAHTASEMRYLYRTDRSPIRQFLQRAEGQVLDLPTLIDRAERLQVISESWRIVRETSLAEASLRSAFNVASQLESASVDQRLSAIVQAAYEVSPELADDLAARLDPRVPEPFINPVSISLQAEKLRSSPRQLEALYTDSPAQGMVLKIATGRLLEDLATGKAGADTSNVRQWVGYASLYPPAIVFDVTAWAVETSHRARTQASIASDLHVFLRGAELAYELAKWVAKAKGDGIPEPMRASFPGLMQPVLVFRPGDEERARQWLQDWLRDNVRHYLKMCDPYLGIEQLDYLAYVPAGCHILIVTTDAKLDLQHGMERLRQEIEERCGALVGQQAHSIQLLIIPSTCDGRFHDRALITDGAGLDLGTSLNGLGKTVHKITVLSDEGARALETEYVDLMLNTTGWFMGGTRPTVIYLGP